MGSALVPRIAQKYRVRTFDTEAFGNSIANVQNVEFVKGDIRDMDALMLACQDVTDVVHLAGVVTDELVDMNQPLSREVNEVGTRNVVRAAKAKGARRFIYASSSSVYGLAAQQHSIVDETIPPQPQTAYAQMKLAGESIVNAELDRDFEVVSVRSATVCGPAPRMRLDTVVNVFSKQAWFDGVITVHGGNQSRSNVHVQDVVDLYLRLLNASFTNGDVFNATLSNMPVLGIARLIADVARRAGKSPIIQIVPINDARSYRLDASKAQVILGWHPSRSLSDAAEDNFAWFDAGGIANPNDDLYYNTRRMASILKEG